MKSSGAAYHADPSYATMKPQLRPLSCPTRKPGVKFITASMNSSTQGVREYRSQGVKVRGIFPIRRLIRISRSLLLSYVRHLIRVNALPCRAGALNHVSLG